MINLSGIMFDSPYLTPQEGFTGKCDDEDMAKQNKNASLLAVITVGTIVLSIGYFIVVFTNEILVVSKRKAMKGQILWHKLKRQHLREILRIAKEQHHGHRLLKKKGAYQQRREREAKLLAMGPNQAIRASKSGPLKVAPNLPS